MWTLEKFNSIYARYQSSGLRVRDFCRNEGIAEPKFYYWQKQLARTNRQADQFVPILLPAGDIPVSTPSSTTSHPSPSAAFPAGGCEITYPDGTILRLSCPMDMSLLKQLLPLTR